MHPLVQRIGLTGGIGSGKSTVARVLVKCGAGLIDADAISRQLTASGGAAIGELAKQFGPQIITADGAMDRDRMRQLAFSDPAIKGQLEAIIHPLVSQEATRQTSAAVQAGRACIVFDIPLLVESRRWRCQLDRVLVIDCTEETQIARVMARNAMSREMVVKIIAGQATRAQRLAAADACICNDTLSLQALERQVRELACSFGL
ncbi:Dephospho-CoA kinase [Polaromonas sp. CG9_12]|uniref:dephospho-CoA kinase n=1 Tax=Polaromonas sp. CG_9.11 TaxID=2787730 RepID=UPI0004DDDADB|nr:dephospho-CoA kinase [Polaromonas sp. CG_9.11]MBG6074878.1 dephospho-CoA kinase [Polaromonas sp. CG_9.11]CDS53779.1 Dephospho-CoA kinase [Polaromonas sp. CG9_12]